MVDHFVKKKAYDCPDEHKEEMKQEAFVRILNSYEKLDGARGWKSFVFNHCRGAVMDYKKFGKGFAEARWSLQKTAKKRNSSFKIHSRIDFDRDNEDQNIDFDTILLNAGYFYTIEEDFVNINWKLVSCMAAQDEIIHVFAKYIRGFKINELGIFFNLSRARICQIIEIFIGRFDAPELVYDEWFLQTCYAFGICRKIGVKDIDQSIEQNFPVGWSKNTVDLDSKIAIRPPNPVQMSLVGDL